MDVGKAVRDVRILIVRVAGREYEMRELIRGVPVVADAFPIRAFFMCFHRVVFTLRARTFRIYMCGETLGDTELLRALGRRSSPLSSGPRWPSRP